MNIYSDIFDTYDIIATESDICVAEYAMESAKYEIDNGNHEFIAVYEAAENAASNSSDNWFQKLKKKVTDFVKTALYKVRAAINHIGNKARLKKSVKMQGKLKEIDNNKLIYPSAIDHMILNNMNVNTPDPETGRKIGIQSSFENAKEMLKKIMEDPAYMKELNKDFIKYFPFLAKYDYFAKHSTYRSKQAYSALQIKIMLDSCSNYLKELVDMFPYTEALLKKARAEGIETSSQRSAIAKLINYLTRTVNLYYSALMRASKAVISGKSYGAEEPTNDPGNFNFNPNQR